MNVGTQIKQSFDGWRLMGTPFVFGLLLLLTPILLMVLLSFWTQDYLDLDRTFTLANYKEVFSHPVFITLIKRSVVISLFVTAFTVASAIKGFTISLMRIFFVLFCIKLFALSVRESPSAL